MCNISQRCGKASFCLVTSDTMNWLAGGRGLTKIMSNSNQLWNTESWDCDRTTQQWLYSNSYGFGQWKEQCWYEANDGNEMVQTGGLIPMSGTFAVVQDTESGYVRILHAERGSNVVNSWSFESSCFKGHGGTHFMGGLLMWIWIMYSPTLVVISAGST